MKRNGEKWLLVAWLAASLAILDRPVAAQTITTLVADNAFTFARIRWKAPDYARFMRFYFNSGPPWSHDYPTAEENMYTALRLLTQLPVTGEAKVVTLDNDEIFEYPMLYICEIGVWEPSDAEAKRLGEYLKRGGFLIVDDFRGRRELLNLIRQMKRIVPEFTYRKLKADHPIFHCFFEFSSLVYDSPYLSAGYFPEYYGWFDPHGRMAAIVNYNNDVGDGWEWPEENEIFSAEAFKLGINYIIYSLTH